MNFIKRIFNNSTTKKGTEKSSLKENFSSEEHLQTYPVAELLMGKNSELNGENLLSQKYEEGGEIMVTAKDMEKLLAQVVKDNGLEGAVIADVEGLPLASYLPSGLDEDEVAAASAAILAISDSKLGDSGKGKVVQASIEAEKGYLVIAPAKGEYVISVLAPKEAKLGIILSAVRSIEKKL
jgi:predicted regulator of Ras-like GTPase activity (Roadblock/LC7/MglB family)